ncbi:hypothetical protein [Sphaerisporangium aureirubrum]|uniref:hypothetical protein n=1 Tax=Sphaerisporangium aureirubrum TaxID=1544736 RepID=UPI0036D27652
MATAITGGFVALAAPATAGAATEARHVCGQRPAYDAEVVAARPGGDDDGKKRSDCGGPAGPPGPRGRLDGVSSAHATPTGGVAGLYIAHTQANGTTLIRDPSSPAPNLRWQTLSTLVGYPQGATGVALSVAPSAPNVLSVTVRSKTGQVATTSCTLTVNPVWPTNCAAFTDITPPL